MATSKLMDAVLESCDESVPRFVVDVGASEGLYTSSSMPLVEAGWNAFLFEPIPIQFKKMITERHANRLGQVQAFNLAITEDFDGRTVLYGHKNDGNGCSTFNHGASLIQQGGKEWNIDAISVGTLCRMLGDRKIGVFAIDIEGMDYIILKKFLQTYTGDLPKFIVTENMSGFSGLKEQELQKREFLLSLGYSHFCDDGHDYVYRSK